MIGHNPLTFVTEENGFVIPASGGTVGVIGGTIEYTDTTEKIVCEIPDNVIPVGILVSVVTDFDDSTGDTLDIGITGNGDYFADDLDVATAGNFDATDMVAGRYGVKLGSSLNLVATYTEDTGDASQGLANILLFYILAGETVELD